MQAAREVAQLALRRAELVARQAQHVARRISAVEQALRRPEQIRHGREPLLGAVVQITADAAALGIRGLDHTGARAPQRGRLKATLELGRGP